MDMTPDQIKALAADWLRWHFAAGADGFVDDLPHDRFAEAEAEKAIKMAPGTDTQSIVEIKSRETPVSARGANPSVPKPRAVKATPIGQAEDLVEQARTIAGAAQTIDALAESMAAFEGCALKTTAKSHIFQGGHRSPKLMLIGDAPEADDDRNGIAYSGPAGVLLDGMLKAIGLTREEVGLGMVIPWRPPGNRPPTAHEIALCEPFLKRHVELLSPKLIMSFGTLAAALLAGTSGTLLKQRGQISKVQIGNQSVELIVTLSPAHLLRYPVQKRFAWQDLKRARDILNGSAQ